MDFFKAIYDWIVGFFGIEDLIKIIKSGDYSPFLTYKGIVSIIGPLFPIVLVVEVLVALLFKKFKAIDYKISFFSYVLNAIIGRFISIAAIVFCIGLFEKYAIFKTTFTWYWFIYGYIVWEFGHFIYHYLGHKVRLFWCLHSTHHAPQAMNLSVSYAHFFLEGPYADVMVFGAVSYISGSTWLRMAGLGFCINTSSHLLITGFIMPKIHYIWIQIFAIS
jgi:sterol desaturase/sphingolipid hydroxylase (fatty acid hydroxylase superfamily)